MILSFRSMKLRRSKERNNNGLPSGRLCSAPDNMIYQFHHNIEVGIGFSVRPPSLFVRVLGGLVQSAQDSSVGPSAPSFKISGSENNSQTKTTSQRVLLRAFDDELNVPYAH